MHLEVIVTLVVAVFGSTGFWQLIMSRRNKKTDEAQLILGLAYSEIIRRAELYIKRGHISTDEYNELNKYLYEPYKRMGGDGTAEKLMEEVKRLPIKEGYDEAEA